MNDIGAVMMPLNEDGTNLKRAIIIKVGKTISCEAWKV
jgi:hypothetical protein